MVALNEIQTLKNRKMKHLCLASLRKLSLEEAHKKNIQFPR